METRELLELLKDMAEKDLSDGSDIEDHPCSLAAQKIADLQEDRMFIGPILDAWEGMPGDLAASLCFDAQSLTSNMEKLIKHIHRGE